MQLRFWAFHRFGPGCLRSRREGVFGRPDAKPGSTYLFALPLLTKASRAQVDITGYSIAEVTGAARVVGYLVYSLSDTPSSEIFYTATTGHKIGGIDVTTLPDHAGQRRVLQPHRSDHLVAMVKVVLTRKVRSLLEGCVVHYRTQGHQYEQKFDCEYTLATDRP